MIAIDGKTLRGSNDTSRDGKAIHVVSAFAAENKLILAQLATETKSNEITAIPLLLDMLDIQGATITIDAAGYQKNIVQDICKNGGNYILALKRNQGNLHAEVENFFKQSIEIILEETNCDYYVSEEKAEIVLKREVWSTNEIDWLPQREEWTDLNTIIYIRSTRKIKETTSIELRFYIANEKASAQKLGLEIRSHWGIENKVHWQ